MNNSRRRRPRILLIPNNARWIIAQMCEQIRLAFSEEFEFFTISEGVFEMRPGLWRPLLAEMDLVHCMNESSGEVLQAAGGTDLPVLTWIHHVTEWSPAHAASCATSTRIVACTDDWKQRIAAYTDLPIHVVRHGVDSARFAPVPGARQKFGIPETDFVVGFFGSKGSDSDKNRKGMDTFLDVVQRCNRQIPNLRILLLGPGWDIQRFQDAGIRVTYPGFIGNEDLPAAYSALDLYLMTARVEGGPCTVLESMACGTPVVATRVGLVPDVIRDRENGMTAEPGDAAAIAAAVVELSRDRALYNRIAQHARETAVALPWKATLAPLGELYRELCRAETRVPNPRLESAEFFRRALAAEELFELRRAIGRASGAQAARVGVKGARSLLRTAGDPATLLRSLRLAARAEL